MMIFLCIIVMNLTHSHLEALAKFIRCLLKGLRGPRKNRLEIRLETGLKDYYYGMF